MKTIAIILALLLAGIGIAAVNAAPQDNATTPAANDSVGIVVVKAAQQATAIPEVIVFEYPAMDGAHKHYFASDLDLTDNKEGKFWNDQISSIVVIEGIWAFLGDPVGAVKAPNLPVVLGPGDYPDLKLKLIEDNTISQIRLEK
jgi:hypothetical protein